MHCISLTSLSTSCFPFSLAAVGSATISVDNIEFGRNESICPVEIVQFTCTGVELGFLAWERNGATIESYTDGSNLNNPTSPAAGITVVLTRFTDVDGLVANFTSTLSINTSVALSSGDNITCGDRRFTDTVTTQYTFRGMYLQCILQSCSVEMLNDVQIHSMRK